jgi:hypothetical protein
MADIMRGLWWCVSGVFATCWLGEDFREGDFFAGCVFWGEVVEVGADEAAV